MFSSASTILAPILLLGLIFHNAHAAGCCSNNYKECDVWWCGSTKSSCENCGDDAFTFLENGALTDDICLKRWTGCLDNVNDCCDGLVCEELSRWYSQCLPGGDSEEEEEEEESEDDVEPATPPPSLRPTSKAPTDAPTKVPTGAPTGAPIPLPVESESEDDPMCGCASCTQNVLTRDANGYSCGSRIGWVIANTDLDEAGACALVGGEEFPSFCSACDPNTCNDDTNDNEDPSPPSEDSPSEDSPSEDTPVQNISWDGNDLVLTHYWDCSGQSCDASTLSPWNFDKYRSPAGYQPQDPNDFGGPSEYGEKLWVTAAIMNIDQGSNDACCGATSTGGCGNCVLIQNPDSLHPDWSVMAMKKNTCGNCRSNPHADINVPGFDVLQYSLANICGEAGTGLTKSESTVLGEWYKSYPNVAEAGPALCGQLPEEFQKGCTLFSEWGWTGGTTKRARYKVVDCPAQFKELIGSLFDEKGIVNV